MLGVVFLFTLRYRGALAGGWVQVALMILGSLTLNGYFYAELSGWNAMALLIAPMLPFLNRLPWLRQRSAWVRTLLVAFSVILLTAPGLGLAVSDYLSEPVYDDY